MTIPGFLLDKIFARMNLSKIVVEGTDEDIDLSIEVEILSIDKKNDNGLVNSGFGLYSTDDDISKINNLQRFFELSVANRDIVDLSNSANIEEKKVVENDRQLTSKTYLTTLDKFFLNKKNIVVFYGSWIQEPTTGRLDFSKVKAEILFEDGKIKSESYIYLLPGKEDVADRIWDGQITLSSDGLSYTTIEAQPRQLERYTVKNYKVQDFRTRGQIDKSIFDYKEINNKIINARSRQLVIREQRKTNYFTDSYISQKENVSLMFGFNFRDIVLHNSLLGKDPGLSLDMREKLYSESKILDLKVIKRKVQETGANDNPLSDIRKTVKPKSGFYEETISSGKDIDNKFVGDELLKESKNVVRNLQNKMRFFSCLDNTNNDSMYQYGIEIEIMDGSVKIISQDIRRLQEVTRTVSEFYNDLDMFINSENSLSLYTESEIESQVNEYFSVLRRYFLIQDINEIKNKILSQLSPIALSLSGLDNFIKLCNSLIANLQNMVGETKNTLSDPHIQEEINVQKNSKNTFFIKHYFKDNVYDTSLNEIKKVEYLPSTSKLFFNEYAFANLNFNNEVKVTKNSSGQPVQTLLPPTKISYKNAVKEIGKTEQKEYKTIQQEQFDKIIRKNLLNHVNININKIYLKDTGLKEKQETEKETDIYQQDLFEMYKYFSSTNVLNKEIDEVFDLYDIYKDDFLARIQFLQDFDSFTGNEAWLDLSNLPNTDFLDTKGTILCRLKPTRKDYRSSKWKISEGLRPIDMFFALEVESLQDINSSFSSFYGSEFAPRKKNNTIKIKKEDDKKQITLQDAETSPTQRDTIPNIKIDNKIVKEQIKSKADKVKKSARNWVLNG